MSEGILLIVGFVIFIIIAVIAGVLIWYFAFRDKKKTNGNGTTTNGNGTTTNGNGGTGNGTSLCSPPITLSASTLNTSTTDFILDYVNLNVTFPSYDVEIINSSNTVVHKSTVARRGPSNSCTREECTILLTGSQFTPKITTPIPSNLRVRLVTSTGCLSNTINIIQDLPICDVSHVTILKADQQTDESGGILLGIVEVKLSGVTNQTMPNTDILFTIEYSSDGFTNIIHSKTIPWNNSIINTGDIIFCIPSSCAIHTSGSTYTKIPIVDINDNLQARIISKTLVGRCVGKTSNTVDVVII